jgi:hypothetical protein
MARVAFKTPGNAVPEQGNRELPLTLDFSNIGMISDTLFNEQSSSQIDFIQSVYIDNSGNAGEFTITFNGMQTIIAQPYTQGIYPVIASGALSYIAKTPQGIKIPLIFSNMAKPFATWGPVPGVSVTPPLVNDAMDGALALGDNVLVAAVAGQSVKLYRGIFSVDAPTILEFTDGPGGAVLFAALLTAGGSLTFQPSGIPWATTSVGNSLILNSSAAVNGYGGFGFVQS